MSTTKTALTLSGTYTIDLLTAIMLFQHAAVSSLARIPWNSCMDMQWPLHGFPGTR